MAPAYDTALTGSTDSDLLRRAQSRQPDAWNQLVDLYGPLVYGWCRQARLQPADAADIVQDVFAALAGSLARFEPRDTGSFRAWLRAVAGHKTCDHLRRHRRGPESPGGGRDNEPLDLLPAPDDPLPEEPAPLRSRVALVQAALERLRGETRDHTWQAFWRTTIDDQPPSDVGADLGMKAGAVYQAKSRTLVRLREIMAELESSGAAG